MAEEDIDIVLDAAKRVRLDSAERIERLEALCRQLAGACDRKNTMIKTACHSIHCGCRDCASNLATKQIIESALEAARKAGISNGK